MSQSKPKLGMKVGNPKAYQEALSKPAPRPGLVVPMSVEAFHYYWQIHHVDVLGWNRGAVVVKKTAVQVEATHE